MRGALRLVVLVFTAAAAALGSWFGTHQHPEHQPCAPLRSPTQVQPSRSALSALPLVSYSAAARWQMTWSSAPPSWQPTPCCTAGLAVKAEPLLFAPASPSAIASRSKSGGSWTSATAEPDRYHGLDIIGALATDWGHHWRPHRPYHLGALRLAIHGIAWRAAWPRYRQAGRTGPQRSRSAATARIATKVASLGWCDSST